MGDDNPTEAATVAAVIRSATAWWSLAADALDEGDLDAAGRYARLGEFGIEGMAERIASMVEDAPTAT